MTHPPPIVQYWDTGQPPREIAELLDSFRAHNPATEHRVFDDVTAAAFLGERYGARELAAFQACAVPAMRADFFRYCAVHSLGGAYCDADFRCLAPLDSLLDGGRRARLFAWTAEAGVGTEPLEIVVNGFFAFAEPGHPLLRLAIDVATANVERRVSENVWMTTGPAIPTALNALRRATSVDAFLADAAGTRFAPLARSVCDVVGSTALLEDAFEGVAISSFDKTAHWIAGASADLSYKQGIAHWHNVEGSIFR